jgi:hypothetical protein
VQKVVELDAERRGQPAKDRAVRLDQASRLDSESARGTNVFERVIVGTAGEEHVGTALASMTSERVADHELEGVPDVRRRVDVGQSGAEK